MVGGGAGGGAEDAQLAMPELGGLLRELGLPEGFRGDARAGAGGGAGASGARGGGRGGADPTDWQQAWSAGDGRYYYYSESLGETQWETPPGGFIPAPWKWTREFHECPDIKKYWAQRYRLYSRYDSGVELDRVGWFSATPEVIAKDQADALVGPWQEFPQRAGAFCVVDAFAGCGGNAIQFARAMARVVAVELDPDRCGMTRKNASIYGVGQRVEVVCGDFLQLRLDSVGADAVFLSPPWGGPEYQDRDYFDPRTDLGGLDGLAMLNAARRVARRAAIFLPRNTDVELLRELVLEAGGDLVGEVTEHPGGKDGRMVKAITAYVRFFLDREGHPYLEEAERLTHSGGAPVDF